MYDLVTMIKGIILRWQAIVLATLSILGSLLASFLVFHLFFKKGGNE